MINVKRRRIELGYTSQKAFADACGIPLGSVNHIEQGLSSFANLTPERLQQWAKALKCKTEELVHINKFAHPVKTYYMDKAKLELYLKAKYGDKIGKVKVEKTPSLLSREYTDYEKENRWVNLEDTRLENWGY